MFCCQGVTSCFFFRCRPSSEVTPESTVVNCAGKSCGKIRSTAGCYALGLLRVLDVIGKGPLKVKSADDAKITEAQTYVPPWWPSESDAVLQQTVSKSHDEIS